ncbi:MAG TPA: MmgE/PrpD family protein [Dehalococcoidia bacterium]|nr:MmgE/PrpD family protein [Dehalococcoidia bacterium]
MPITEHIVDIALGLMPGSIPTDARTVARHCLLDWLGCGIAGSTEPLSEILVREVGASGGEATLLGRSERARPLDAALINGAMSHALDFDDTHTLMSGHPSVPVLPAVVALAEREDATGAALIDAVVAGIETECRLGALMNPAHYAAGFHATGTLGTFGAAAACAHLLGLTREQRLHALGLAGTQAAGLKSGFGTMAKPLHAGRAAANGLLAALLARDGFTGNSAILEAAQGFASTHAAGELHESVLDGLDGRFLITDTLFKYHASCYLTHAAIDAAIELRETAGIVPGDIEAVEVHASTGCIGVCDIAAPSTGLEGKFSLRATTAMALLGDDTSDPAAFSDDRMRSPQLIAMREQVAFVPVRGLAITRATVVVRACGREFPAEADTGVPERDLDRQWQRLEAKFLALTSPVIGEQAAFHLRDAVAQVEEAASVRDVTGLARLSVATPA